jgi:predicted O-methyltransferase YrrM
MGSIHKPPVSNLVLALAQAGNLKLFVETGTFQGDSLRWASQNFDRVWTVEISEQYQAEAKAKVEHCRTSSSSWAIPRSSFAVSAGR